MIECFLQRGGFVMLYVKAPAKINLTLDVLYKREDNYHEVEMVMTTIDLADRIGLSLRQDGKIVLSSTDQFVPTDQRNFAYQAARLLQQRFKISAGVTIKIEKEIPIAAGLAGGSTDAAATLRGLNVLWQLNLTLDELADIGAEIGSDVPFCVYGGTAHATGRGEQIREISAPPTCWVVLAKPKVGVSTADIYGGLNLTQVKHPNTQEMLQAIEQCDYKAMCRELGNVLEDVTLKLHPEVVKIKSLMERSGADAVLMSGSGPTVFGLVDSEIRVSRIVNALRGFCEDVYAVRMLGERHKLA